MNQPVPLIRHPIRRASIIALVLSLIFGSVAFFVPGVEWKSPFAVVGVIGYGAFLGWFGVGIALAAPRPPFRYWLAAGVLPVIAMAAVSVEFAYWAESMLRYWSLIGGVLITLLATFLLAGCLVAASGWWRYACAGVDRNILE